MIKILNKSSPKQQWINKNKISICVILSIFFTVLLWLLLSKYKTFSTSDMIIIISVLLSQLSTFYACFVNWNSDILMYNHYIFVVVIYLVLILSSNKYLLLYYLGVVLCIIVVWNTKKRCVFDKLSWDFEIFGYKYKNNQNRSGFMIYILLVLYPLKMWYLK